MSATCFDPRWANYLRAVAEERQAGVNSDRLVEDFVWNESLSAADRDKIKRDREQAMSNRLQVLRLLPDDVIDSTLTHETMRMEINILQKYINQTEQAAASLSGGNDEERIKARILRTANDGHSAKLRQLQTSALEASFEAAQQRRHLGLFADLEEKAAYETGVFGALELVGAGDNRTTPASGTSTEMDEIPSISVRLPWQRVKNFKVFEMKPISSFPDDTPEQAVILASAGVTVEKKKRGQHPWFGKGFKLAYSFSHLQKQTKPRQGVHLVARRGGSYSFDLVRVSSDHPFYISMDDKGGPGASWSWDSAMKSGVTTPTYGRVMQWDVPATIPSDMWYACKNHEWMGGPVSIVAREGSIVAHLAEKNVMVMRNNETGSVYASTEPDKHFNTLDALLLFHGIGPGVAMCKLDQTFDRAHHGAELHTLSAADKPQTVGEMDDSTPIRLMRNNTPLCWHVHTKAALLQWIQIDMPSKGAVLCPKCAAV